MKDDELARTIYAGQFAQAAFEDRMTDMFVGEWDFGHTTYDNYDRSFEFKDCVPSLRLNNAQKEYFVRCGFLRCWLCHTDGWETYYYLKDGAVIEHRKKAVTGGASCQSSEHAVPETASNDEQRN